ncbi:hypothetical protein GCK32_016259 [Trichostrongylus colubriformis]|uniref:Uncharacterized protein n=1 Tax=Trichostrongylus colubriformis TaxID=6319 RepID=A0AAN8IIX1_TRICO
MKNNGKKAREQNESSDDIDPAAIVRDIVKCSHRKAVRERKLGADHIRKPFLYLMRYPCSMYLHDCCPLASSSVVRYEQINEATLSVQKDNGESAVSNSDKGTKPIKGKSRSVSHTFIGKEITVDEIASAIIRMETDIFKKKGTSLHMTKAAVVSVIEEVQRYIIDQLKFDPVDFVSVRLRSTASSARLILKAQDRTPRGTGKIHRIRLEGAVKLCKLKDRNDKCLALTREKENGILTYEGKEVTVGVIVKAIAKMIREIYGKKPPFRISRSGLTEFITNKQEKIFEALKLKASNWTHSDKLEAKVPINAAEQPTSQNVVELPELKTAKAANARRKIKPIFIRRRLSSIENKKARRKKKPRPSVEQAESSRPRQEPLRDHPHRILNESCKEKLKTAHTDVERVDKETAIAVEPKAISTPTLVKDEQGDKWSADEGSNGTCNSDSSKELVAIRGKFTRCYLTRLNGFRGRTDRPLYSCSKNSIYRGRRHKMFISDMSPRKDKKISPKRKTKSVEEQMSSTNITEVTAQAVTDYSSIHDRMTAAPTSIVIRTVEKRSKKRGKKGWRKSWI